MAWACWPPQSRQSWLCLQVKVCVCQLLRQAVLKESCAVSWHSSQTACPAPRRSSSFAEVHTSHHAAVSPAFYVLCAGTYTQTVVLLLFLWIILGGSCQRCWFWHQRRRIRKYTRSMPRSTAAALLAAAATAAAAVQVPCWRQSSGAPNTSLLWPKSGCGGCCLVMQPSANASQMARSHSVSCCCACPQAGPAPALVPGVAADVDGHAASGAPL